MNEEHPVTRWIHRPGSVWVAVDGGTLVAHPDVPERFRLDGVGVLLWERLVERRSLAELVGAVVAAYDVAPGDAESDVARFLETLGERGLLLAER